MRKLNKHFVDLFLTTKRRRKAKRKSKLLSERANQRLRAWYYRNRRAKFFGTTSLIAQMLGSGATRAFEMPQTSLYLSVPKVFSMQTATEDVLEFVAAFARTHQTRSISDVYVDFSPVESQDLGAHALLDLLVEEIRTQTMFRGGRMRWSGRFPKGKEEKRFIRAMGIIRTLQLQHHALEDKKILVFDRRVRDYVHRLRKADPNNKPAQAHAAEKFADHLNKCLAKEGRQLTPAARAALCEYVVEIIDNAERHSGMVDWSIQGYIDLGSNQPHCEIVILNFGKSISEVMGVLPEDSFTYDQIKGYIDAHSSSGWFKRGWNPETLRTLVAIQGGVSSRNFTAAHTGGQGTADLIEFFQRMHAERLEAGQDARMYIVSGSTKVVIDGRYQMVRDSRGRTIAFNRDNDLRQPPDPSCVMSLAGPPLPGTIIGIKFPVQAESLQEASTP